MPIVAFTPPKFEPGDPAALQYLEENGYVVYGKVASPEEVAHAIDLFWTHFETETKGKVRACALRMLCESTLQHFQSLPSFSSTLLTICAAQEGRPFDLDE